MWAGLRPGPEECARSSARTGLAAALTIILAAGTGATVRSNVEQHEPTRPAASEARSPDLWRFYMHGITDDFATPVDITSLIELPPRGSRALVASRIDTPYVREQTTAVRLEAGEHAVSEEPVPLPIEEVRGHTLRFFTWVRGEDTGREASTNSYGDAPRVALVARDADGRQLARSSEMDGVGTTGTFPWHCYHIEMFVPREAAGLFVELENPAGGRAWFARTSWEIGEGSRAFTLDERQDPGTGSVASNVLHDALNRQFHRGVPTAHVWNFLQGPNAGLVGQRYDITTPDGLRAYYENQVRTDADHVNHSLMYLASRYHVGRASAVLPAGVDEAWLDQLRELVVGAQDRDTGYWGTRTRPASMGMTFHVIEGLFAYYGPRRTDRAEATNDRRHLGVARIPLADRIIGTTLSMQASRPDGDDADALAAWPRHAYDFTAAPDASRSRASLVVTGNAIELLRRSERFVGASLQHTVYGAIRAAVRYVLETCVNDDGVWRQSDIAAAPSSGGYMERILGMSHYLERRVDPSVPPPRLRVERVDDDARVRLSWLAHDARHVAVRVYSIDSSRSVDELDESDIVAIAHRTGDRPVEMDPLIAARTMGRAAARRWGRGWNRASYVGEKVNRLRADVLITRQLAAVGLSVAPNHQLYAAAVNWYGEESTPIPIEGAGPHAFTKE